MHFLENHLKYTREIARWQLQDLHVYEMPENVQKFFDISLFKISKLNRQNECLKAQI